MRYCLCILILSSLLAGSAYASHGYATVLDSFSVENWTYAPMGIAYDGTDLWLTDTYSNKLLKFTTTGSFLASFDLAPVESPVGISWDGSNFWMIGTPGTSFRNFYHVNTTGSVLSSITGVLNYYFPAGVQYISGNCWVTSNYYDRKVYLHSMSNGSILNSFTTSAKYPCGICYDGTNLLVSGGEDGRTHRYSTTGSYLDYFLAPFTSNGYDGDSVWVNGNMYWVNGNNRTVYHISIDWNPPAVETASLGLVRSLFK